MAPTSGATVQINPNGSIYTSNGTIFTGPNTITGGTLSSGTIRGFKTYRAGSSVHAYLEDERIQIIGGKAFYGALIDYINDHYPNQNIQIHCDSDFQKDSLECFLYCKPEGLSIYDADDRLTDGRLLVQYAIRMEDFRLVDSAFTAAAMVAESGIKIMNEQIDNMLVDNHADNLWAVRN